MIQTYVEHDHVVQAIRFTGTESSARSVCRWLGISTWNIGLTPTYTIASNGTVGRQVKIPAMWNEEVGDQVLFMGDYIVRNKTNNVTVVPKAEFESRYERV